VLGLGWERGAALNRHVANDMAFLENRVTLFPHSHDLLVYFRRLLTISRGVPKVRVKSPRFQLPVLFFFQPTGHQNPGSNPECMASAFPQS
jgi:hypothetical protein